MDQWQKDILGDQESELIQLISVNNLFLSHLSSKRLLHDHDKDVIMAEKTPIDKATSLLRYLKTRHAFYVLVEALEVTRQSGAAEILRRNISSRPGPAALWNATSKVYQVKKYVQEYCTNHYQSSLVVKVNNGNTGASQSGKGQALIISIGNYSKSCQLPSASQDRYYMKEVFRQLGYEIFTGGYDETKEEWNETEFKDIVMKFRDHCDKAKTTPEKVFVYISSHGSHDHICTSDEAEVHLEDDVFSKFDANNRHGGQESLNLGDTHKVFLVDACQTYTTKAKKLGPPPVRQNMLIALAQIPGRTAKSYLDKGSYYTHCLAYVFMNYSSERSILGLFEQADEIMKETNPSQVPVVKLSQFQSSNVYLTL